jgi:hypothetical protein
MLRVYSSRAPRYVTVELQVYVSWVRCDSLLGYVVKPMSNNAGCKVTVETTYA